jgi:nanoRNase/pAp phosphatase (c-di-AMP/oligoRNAs hydrolase)
MSLGNPKMRLLTRSDFDGLACAVLLKEINLIDSYKFVHPKDVQDGKIEVTPNDVLANIPYVPGCGLWFDHHLSEQTRLLSMPPFEGSFKEAPSCARVIWDYYGGHDKIGTHLDAMMEAIDRCDGGNLSVEDIENPQGWVLLSFVMDSRTGLGRFRDYRISNYQSKEEMVEHCRTQTIDEILALPDVQERLKLYNQQDALFREMIAANATQRGNVVVIDLRNENEIYAGNRFVLYTMFPTANISIQMMWGFRKQNIVQTCGHSITNRPSKTDVGNLMLRYGGGGHKADQVLEELVSHMNHTG